jgi:hypothetical protein
MREPGRQPQGTKRRPPLSAAVGLGDDQRVRPVRGSRCLDSTKGTNPIGRTSAAPLIRISALGLVALGLTALGLFAITSGGHRLNTPAQVSNARSGATPSRRVKNTTGPGADRTPPPRQTPHPPPNVAWPTGAQATELALIATNIPPGDTRKSTTLLLDVKSDRYVLLSPGDQVGEFEVVSIAMDWVQLRRTGSYSWVGYRKGDKRRASAPTSEHRPPPPRIRRSKKTPSVTYKWIVGRLNLAGELQDHLRPTETAKGLKVGRVTSGFRRIGVRVGDVVLRAGEQPVRSLEALRNGLQRAAQHQGSGSITVLRGDRKIKLSFGVR